VFNISISKSIINTFLYQIVTKAIGYIKYLLFAFLFGLSFEMDAYNMALTILDVSMFVLGHTFSVVGVPQLVKAREKSLLAFKKLSGSIFIFSIVLAMIIIPLQYIYFDNLISLLAPGFDVDKMGYSKDLFNYFLPMSVVYLPYFALMSFFRALNLFSVANLLEFIIAIVSFLYLIIFMKNGINIIPLSLDFAYIIAFVVGVYFAIKYKIIGFYGSLNTISMKKIYKNILKLSLWFLVLQLYRVVDKGFASLLEDGMISALIYASMLISSFTFIFDFAYIYLTKFSQKNDKSILFTMALRLYLFLSIPIMVFLVFYSYEFIGIIFGHGAFTQKSVEITASIMMISTPLIFLGLANGLFQSLYQSLDKYSYIIFLSFIGVSINFGLNYVLIDNYGIYGISFATTVSTIVIFMINIYLLNNRENIKIEYKKIIKDMFVLLSLSVVSIVVVKYIVSNFYIALLISCIVYLLLLAIIKNEFYIKIYNIIRKK
jgi:putative peptidoglycan lipid II flippase